MSIRLAAPQPPARVRCSAATLRRVRCHAANDNGPATAGLLDAALRHFAAHGLAAAQEAARLAMAAHEAGDDAAALWWQGICRTLDRRLAARLFQRDGARGQMAGTV